MTIPSVLVARREECSETFIRLYMERVKKIPAHHNPSILINHRFIANTLLIIGP